MPVHPARKDEDKRFIRLLTNFGRGVAEHIASSQFGVRQAYDQSSRIIVESKDGGVRHRRPNTEACRLLTDNSGSAHGFVVCPKRPFVRGESPLGYYFERSGFESTCPDLRHREHPKRQPCRRPGFRLQMWAEQSVCRAGADWDDRISCSEGGYQL